MDSGNRFDVVAKGDRVVILSPVSYKLLSHEEALVLLVWLAVHADPELKEAHRLLAEIKSS